MKTYLSDSDPDAYSPIMICPKCGYKTTATNICRGCVKTPADEEAIRPVYCATHKVCHYKIVDGRKVWTMHRSVIMKYSGKVRHALKRGVRKYEPKDATEKARLWSGYGVVFVANK